MKSRSGMFGSSRCWCGGRNLANRRKRAVQLLACLGFFFRCKEQPSGACWPRCIASRPSESQRNELPQPPPTAPQS
ncbi:hypothetical protein HDV62DRAFT_374421 [Trichoderma sp. SZMC 28011]